MPGARKNPPPHAGTESRERLERENVLLRSILDFSPDPIFVKDRSNKYILVNRSFLQVCRLERAEGFTDAQLFAPDFVRIIREHDDAVLQEGRIWRAEEQLDIGGAVHTFMAIKFPLRGDDGSIFAMGGIATDITAQKEAEARNTELVASERAAQREADMKSAFLATISHELRTPVGGIVGLADLLREAHGTQRATGFVENIAEAANGLLRLVNDLLDLSKLKAGKMDFEAVPFSVHELLDGVCHTLRPAAKANALTLDVQIKPPGSQYYSGDALRIRQVLLNLMGNAVKFSSQGMIRVVVEPAPASFLHAEVGQTALIFRVIDHGPGIREQDLGKLFTEFHQLGDSTARRFGGTGLGLSICRSLVRGMGGDIGVRSRFGHGSEFWFTLQLTPCEKPAAVVAEPPRDIQPLTGRILLVEDNNINQLVLSTMLNKMGLDVTLTDNGLKAVCLTEDQTFDVILMDCHMPEMDGFEATRIIRKRPSPDHLPRPPIIALTAAAMPGERTRCLNAGMDNYLTKPVKFEDLYACLRESLRAHSRTT